MTMPQWSAMLNDRVYFWLRPKRLATLLLSRPNRNCEHDVVTIATASLVAVHHDVADLPVHPAVRRGVPRSAPRHTEQLMPFAVQAP